MVVIVGAGLAGCEAALILNKHGINVELIEAKPLVKSPAHSSDNFAEVVCSNSFKSNDINTAGGLIKEELRVLNSPLMEIADKVKVAAGGALAVDRDKFCAEVTKLIKEAEFIRISSSVVDQIDFSCPTIIATGPLTMGGLNDFFSKTFGRNLYFYDAEAPIVDADSIDFEHTFTASRYGKGSDDYINCPINRDEYYKFVSELINAQKAIVRNFEKREIFEGCMPIEIMAARGVDTLRFGPLKPVGMIDPKTGKRPFAVVQLRKENEHATMYNIVGFQTNLKIAEQKRVFGIIPALKNAEYHRYGVMHRNTYINAPEIIDRYFRIKKYPNCFIAGQLSGVEGYVESIASGHIAALNMVRYLNGLSPLNLPDVTIIGALSLYLEKQNANFQPMNANFGILPPLENSIRDKSLRKAEFSKRSIAALKNI